MFPARGTKATSETKRKIRGFWDSRQITFHILQITYNYLYLLHTTKFQWYVCSEEIFLSQNLLWKYVHMHVSLCYGYMQE